MKVTQAPYPQFLDADGTPLDGGRIYFGQPNQNPETAPVAIYWDQDGTQPAAQPVRTVNGYMARAGSPGVVYTPADYSITVKSEAGQLIYYAADSSKFALDSAVRADLAGTDAGQGASMVAFKRSAVGSVAHDLALLMLAEEVNAWEFLTDEQIADVQARTVGFDLTTPLQLFLNACRGKRGRIPAGTYRCDGVLKYDPLHPTVIRGDGWNSDNQTQGTILRFTDANKNGLEVVYNYAQWPAGGGADAHTAYDAGVGGTPLGNSDNLVIFQDMGLIGPGADKTAGTQSIQLFGVGPETQPTGNGVFAYWCNAMNLKNLWVSGWPNVGAKLMWCFASKMEGGYYVANRSAGISAVNVNNAVVIDGVRAIANGMVSGPFASFNIFIGTEGASAASWPNLGVTITGETDFEGAGGNALPGYSFSAASGTISAVTVSGGIATATLVGTVNFAATHWVGINGGTSVAGNAALNTAAPAVLLTKTTSQITWATSAPDGTYATTGLKIGPYVAGLGLKGAYGSSVDGYAEGCTGPSIYVYQDCRGVDIKTGTYSDAKIYVDGYWYGAAPAVVAGGTGYAVNDVLTVSGGTLQTGQPAATVKVTSVSAGAITGLQFVDAGKYFVPPGASALDPLVTALTTGTVALTGGTGSGATMTCDWLPIGPSGIRVTGNQFYGANGGIYAQTELGLDLADNQYLQTSAERPGLYLGWLVSKLSPSLREVDVPIVQGAPLGNRGINQFAGPTVPGHWTNFFQGMGAGQKLQDSGGGLGRQITATGTLCLANVTTAYSTTAGGFMAGYSLQSGFFNTLYGNRVAQDGTNLTNIAAFGTNALKGVTSGGAIVAMGVAAGAFDTAQADTGNSVYLGTQAGRRSGAAAPWDGCTVIGNQGTPWAGGSIVNFVGIGRETQPFAASFRVQLGDSTITSLRCQVALTVVSDRRAKTEIVPLTLGLDFVRSLQPVSYRRIGAEDQGRELGFIAQEVDAALKAAGAADTGVVPYDETADRYGLRTQDLIAALTKAVQELAAEVDALKAAAAAH